MNTIKKIVIGNKGLKDFSISSNYQEIIDMCMNKDPIKRPSFDEIQQKL